MKPLTQQIAWGIMTAGMFVGSLVCLAGASYLLKKRAWASRNIWLLPIAAGTVCGWVGYAVLCAAFLHEKRYGFDFNDPTIRLKFLHWGWGWASCGMFGALFGRERLRTLLLIACLLLQTYWFLQAWAI